MRPAPYSKFEYPNAKPAAPVHCDLPNSRSHTMRLNRFMIRPLVEAGLREELNAGDTTGGFLIWDDDPVQTAQIYANARQAPTSKSS